MNIFDAMMSNQDPTKLDILADSNQPAATLADLQNQVIPKTPMAQQQAGLIDDGGPSIDLSKLSQSLQSLQKQSQIQAPALGLANTPQPMQQPAIPLPQPTQQPSQAAQAIQGGIGAQPNMQQIIAMLRGF